MEQTSERHIEEILSKLTLKQKARLCQGLDAWNTFPIEQAGVPKILMTDGPHGLRKQLDESNALLTASEKATCFPTASATACSFDTDLLKRIGTAIGEEAREQGVSLVLGPGVNIQRSPLCGRNFEYFSEDPLLSGEMGAALAQGIQSTGTGSCVKHYTANNREYFRMIENSVVDSRALNEIYLKPFKIVIKKARPYAVMSSYNRINGEYTGESKHMITEILRGEFGHDGIVVSDWGAVCSRVNGIKAGMDLEMPYSGKESTNKILRAISDGEIDEEDLNKCVRRMLKFIFKCQSNKKLPYECDMEAHHKLAREAAVKSAVLLKNDDNTLPLNKGERIALIGAFAQNPRYQGEGSSKINPADLESVLGEFAEYGITFEFAKGYNADSSEPDVYLENQAEEAAAKTGTAVIFVGLPDTWEVEGVDRDTLNIPKNQNDLISKVAKAARKTIVVLMGGSPVSMPWLKDADAVLNMHLGGEAVASAVCELLLGIANPSGKCAQTYPLTLSDAPASNFFDDNPYNCEYRESIYAGYRYYVAANKKTLFPFGFGLTYTRFEFKDFSVVKDENGDVAVSFSVTNAGGRAGCETPQIYLESPATKERKLAAFAKCEMQPGKTKRVELKISGEEFDFYNISEERWQRENKKVLIGNSCVDIFYEKQVEFEGTKTPPVYEIARDAHWSTLNYYALFDKIPLSPAPSKPYGMNATLTDIDSTKMGKAINNMVRGFVDKNFNPENNATNIALHHAIKENPFRALVSLSGGAFSYDMAAAALKTANGNPVVGILQFIAAVIKSTLKLDKERNK